MNFILFYRVDCCWNKCRDLHNFLFYGTKKLSIQFSSQTETFERKGENRKNPENFCLQKFFAQKYV